MVSTLTALFLQRENDIEASHNINALRAYTSSVRNTISDDYPVINELSLTSRLNDLNITALIANLSGDIIYNNTSFSTTNVTHELYQDQTYSSNNEDMIKVSFTVKDDTSVIGFVVFEVPKAELNTSDYTFFYVIILVEVIVLLSLIGYLISIYKKIIVYPIKKLDNALLDISNGVYNTLVSSSGVSIKSFTYYNIMLEKMENMLSTQANYAKSRKQLIANISHEVRTPLSYVKMSAELLSNDDSINEKSKKHITTILSKITSIDSIIEDLFRYSKQDLDQLLVELKETYAKDMFERIFKNIKPKDEKKNISINIDNGISNVLINADESRLVQVVSNMVDNAEKHIPHEGFINIKTEIDENHLVLIIEDSGEGIESKDLPYIFEPFYQGTQDSSIKKKGAGLGLAICDYIIKEHHGEIFVYSEKNKGTKFIVKFQEIK